MMPWAITIGGVPRTANILDRAVEIDLVHNERGTARFTTKPGYIPDLRQDVVIYDTDGVTPIFGGVIFNRRGRGAAKHLFAECECTDWTWYFDRLTVTAGGPFTGTLTLKDVLLWLQANTGIAAYGFTLDPAQVTGPVAAVSGFTWERKYLSDVLRDLTTWSGGYVFYVTPTKQWGMMQPNLTIATAPFSITDADTKKSPTLDWEESSDNYATRIIGVVGGTEAKATTQTWTVDAGIIAAGYVQTDAPSTPLGGVSATVNGSPVTVGAPGSQLVWDWSAHRLFAGTLVPNIGDVVALTYMAQYPFEVVADAGISPPIERVVKFDDLTDVATAVASVNGTLTQAYQNPRTFTIDTYTHGLRPGQVITINSPTYRATNLKALITRIKIDLITNTTWRYRADAISGIYQSSPLDFWRGVAGDSTSNMISVTYTEGTNPSADILPDPFALGGSLNRPLITTTWAPVETRVRYTARQSFTARVRVWAFVKTGGGGGGGTLSSVRYFPLVWLTTHVFSGGGGSGTVDVRLQKLTGTPATVGQLAAPTSATTVTEFVINNVPIVAGDTYELQQISSSSTTWGYASGVLEPVSS